MRKIIPLVGALLFLGCSSNSFNTPQLLNIPRILAIQAEPPQPKVGTATTLRTLFYLPAPDQGDTLTYSWSWCPLPTSSNNGYQCPIDQAMFDQIYTALGGGQAPSLDLGTAQTATLVNPFPAPMLKALCDGTLVLDPTAPPGGSLVTSTDGGKSSFDCAPGVGFPITVYFSLGGTTSGKLDSVYTVYLPTDDNAPGNLNPVLGDILVTAEFVAGPDGGVASPDGDSSSPDAGLPSADADLQDANTPTEDAGPVAEDAAPLAEDAQSPTDTSLASGSNGVLLDDAGTVVVRRQQRVGLEVLINRSSSEPLAAAQIASNPNKKTTERLDLSWFAEGGDFGSDGLGGHRTYFPGFPETPDLPFINAINNTWTLPKKDDYQSNTSRLIVVVRDIRGGVAWTSGTASLEPTP